MIKQSTVQIGLCMHINEMQLQVKIIIMNDEYKILLKTHVDICIIADASKNNNLI